MEGNNITYTSAELTQLPKETVKPSLDEARKLLKLMDLLEDHDDVQEVYGNFDIADEIMEEIAS